MMMMASVLPGMGVWSVIWVFVFFNSRHDRWKFGKQIVSVEQPVVHALSSEDKLTVTSLFTLLVVLC